MEVLVKGVQLALVGMFSKTYETLWVHGACELLTLLCIKISNKLYFLK